MIDVGLMLTTVFDKNNGHYEPSHPWYYKNNRPLFVHEIAPEFHDVVSYIDGNQQELRKLLTKPEKFAKEYVKVFNDIKERTAVYYELLKKPPVYKSEFDRMINDYSMSLSLVHNHILYYTTRIIALDAIFDNMSDKFKLKVNQIEQQITQSHGLQT